MKGNARSSGYDRAAHDWYVEPRRAIDELLDVETFEGLIWDPCCGGGNIPKACNERGLWAMGSDIVDRGYGATADFLATPIDAAHFIMNPPFTMGVTFALRALSLCLHGKICVLQRTAWLEGNARYNHLFSFGALARVWQFRSRISIPPGEQDIPARNGSVPYAWFVFENGHTGPAALSWLP